MPFGNARVGIPLALSLGRYVMRSPFSCCVITGRLGSVQIEFILHLVSTAPPWQGEEASFSSRGRLWKGGRVGLFFRITGSPTIKIFRGTRSFWIWFEASQISLLPLGACLPSCFFVAAVGKTACAQHVCSRVYHANNRFISIICTRSRFETAA